MKRFLRFALVLLGMAALGHVAILYTTPGLIMTTTMQRMAQAGLQIHQFTLAPRTTPQTQTVVRPSPDLAYSVCLFDLKEETLLRVHAAPYDRYSSLSFFDDQTNNFATVRISADGASADGADIVLRAPGQAELDPYVFAGRQIEAPSVRGLILIRRLAPTAPEYDRVATLARADRCGPFRTTP